MIARCSAVDGTRSISGVAMCGASRHERSITQHVRTGAASASAPLAAATASRWTRETAAAGDGADRQAATDALLHLLSPDAKALPLVAARQLPGGAGVGLVATRHVPPDALLLAVPFSLVLETSDGEVTVLSNAAVVTSCLNNAC